MFEAFSLNCEVYCFQNQVIECLLLLCVNCCWTFKYSFLKYFTHLDNDSARHGTKGQNVLYRANACIVTGLDVIKIIMKPFRNSSCCSTEYDSKTESRAQKGFWKIFSAELKSILFRVCFLKPSMENLRDYNNRGMADCNIHKIGFG